MLISAPLGSSGFAGLGIFADFGAAKKKVKKKAVKGTARSGVSHFKPAPKVTARSGVAHFKPAPTAKQAKAAAKETAKRLQTALVIIGRTVGDTTLANVKIDGAAGQKTADAVNRAFTKHIGAGQAPAQYRTGKLPLALVKSNAAALAGYIEKEIMRRGGTVVSPAVAIKGTAKYKASLKATAAAAKKAAKAKVAAAKLAAKRAATAASAKSKATKALQAKARANHAAAVAKQARSLASRTTDPTLKARYTAQAAAAESEAAQEGTAASALATEAVQETQAVQASAPTQVAQEAAADATSIEAQRQAAASSTARAPITPTSMEPSEGGGFLPAAAAALTTAAQAVTDLAPSTPEAPASTSIFSQYKLPLIVAGVVGLAGVAFLVLKKPAKPGAKSPSGRNR